MSTAPATPADKLARIREIDAMFERADSWGSWMADAANERHRLVEDLRRAGHDTKHRWSAHVWID